MPCRPAGTKALRNGERGQFQLGQLQSPGDGDSRAEPQLRAWIPPAPAPADISGDPQRQLGAVGDVRGFQLDTPLGMGGEAPMGRALLLPETETEDQLLCTRSKQCLEAKSFPNLAGLGRDVLFVSLCVRERFIKSM